MIVCSMSEICTYFIHHVDLQCLLRCFTAIQNSAPVASWDIGCEFDNLSGITVDYLGTLQQLFYE